MSKRQQGFTLIELTIVIVVLAILSAFLVPRIGELFEEARAAKVRAMGGALAEGATIAHAVQLAELLDPSQAVDYSDGGVGPAIDMENRYPSATGAGICNTLSDSKVDTIDCTDLVTRCTDNDSTMNPGDRLEWEVAIAGTSITFGLCGSATPTNCSVTYTEPANLSEDPVISMSLDGCK